MADITFTGKMYDENGTLINGTVEGFTSPQNKWSGAKASQLNEYTINVGDGDWLTNDGSIAENEVVLLKFVSASGIAVISHTITNADISTRLVVQDVQLLPIQAPTCGLNLAITGTVNNIVTATNTSSDQYQWEYAGKTHHQRYDWYGTVVFPEIGIASVEYDFGEGYSVSNTYVWDTIGTYTVSSKTTNKNGQTRICTKEIVIGYNAPTGCVQFDKATYILNDTVIVTGCITDADNRIIGIDHIWEEVITDTNLIKDYMYSKVLDEVKTYTAKQIIRWNDGFEDKVVEFTRPLSMANQPPVVDITVTEGVDTYTFNSNAVDPEGMLARVDWIVYTCKQEIMGDTGPCDWVEVYRTTGEIIELSVGKTGNYKVVATAYDNVNATGTDEIIQLLIGVGEECTGGPVVENKKHYYIFDKE